MEALDTSSLNPSRPLQSGTRKLGLLFEVHDRHQLEFRFNFRISPRPQQFVVDTFFFIPRNIGVHSGNYSRDDFYRDVTAHLRMDAPPQKFARLATHPREKSPLHELREALERYQSGQGPSNSRSLPAHAKLFAFLFAGEMRRKARRLRKRIARPDGKKPTIEQLERSVTKTERQVTEVFQAFRDIKQRLGPFASHCHRPLWRALRWADEYMSLVLDAQIARTAQAISAEPSYFRGDGRGAAIVTRLRAFLAHEAEYRRSRGYLIRDDEDPYNAEYFTYRRSMLKKSIHQALYLDVRQLKRDAFLRNSIAGVGAALAAIWAWATQVPATVANLSSETKFLFFGAAVLGYVAKDRIKALTNEYLTGKLRRFDQSSVIKGRTLGHLGLGLVNAAVRERMTFAGVDELDPEVRRLRFEPSIFRDVESGANPEEVIHYHKQITLHGMSEKSQLGPRTILDILRLNVRPFLERLDEPVERIDGFDPKTRQFERKRFPRVYHLNVVIRLARVDDHGEANRFARFRVVLNKNGIVRVSKA